MLRSRPPGMFFMRKPIALFLLGFIATSYHAESAPSASPSRAGLPKEVLPQSYLIYLEPDVGNGVTEGVESVEIEVLQPTNRIVLNAFETQITEARIQIGDRAQELSPQFDSNQQTVSFALENVLPPGKFTLSIKFQSRIAEQPQGLFILRYGDGLVGAAARLLATKLQTTGSRVIFPSWDEPAFRATFQLSIKTETQNTVISNMPVFVEQPVGPDQKIVVFEKTPLLTSRAVLLECGKLEWLEDEVAGVKIRVLTTPGKKELGRYAIEVTKQLLPYFNNYFAIPFPNSKLDQIAFPSEVCSTIQDCDGLVYDEEALLCSPETSSESTRQKIFLAVAQKIASQWLGDRMGMVSQSDFWVKEGFAPWMAKKAAAHFNPRWKIWLQAAVEKERAMAFDAGETTHPVQSPGLGEEETTSAVDLVTSQKPWLLLRMLEYFLGEDRFRDGVQAYLAAHQGSDRPREDFWASLERATGRSIKKMVTGWTEQPGFPLIKITTQCVNGHRIISLEQVPYVLGRRGEIPLQWSVPIGIRPTVKSNEVKYALLDKLTNNFDLAGCSGFIQANAGNVGYFRVLYEPALFSELEKNVEKLPESERLNLTTDTWALVESGHLPVSSYFDLLENLRHENSLAVWQNALGTGETFGALRLIDRLEQGRPGREAYQRYICSFFGPKFRELGWDERAGEDSETQSYRAMLVETLGFFGDRDVIDESFRRFENYRKSPASLAPNLRSAVITIVGRYSSQALQRELLSMADDTPSGEEKRMLWRALGVALDPETARETLQYLVSDKVPPGDAAVALEYFAAEGDHPDIAWAFTVAHLKEMQERFGLLRLSRLLSTIVTGFTDEQQADAALAFVQANLPPVAVHELKEPINEIRFRARLKVKTLPAIDDWIKARLQGNRDNPSRNP
jgi:aminopeptidase N